MLKSAFSFSHPTAIRFPKGKGLGVPLDESFTEIPVAKSECLKEGKDLLLALGSMVYPALRAAERLEQKGISLAVINARFAKPLDEEMILRYARSGGRIITAEEGVIAGGFGSAVRELLDRERRSDVRFKSIGLSLEIYPLGSVEEIKREYKLDEEGIFYQIQSFYREKGKSS
jgi:1-deoxy-D-xylulose-5-phosphate synthase